MTRALRAIAVLCAVVTLAIVVALWLLPARKGNPMTDKIKLLLAYAVVGVLAVLGSLYAPGPELKASCAGIAVGVTLFMRSILQPPPPPSPPSPPSSLMTMAVFALGAIGLTVVVAFFSGCGFLEKHPKLLPDVTKEVLCVLASESDDPAVLIAECGAEVGPILNDLLAEKKAAKKAGFKLSLDAGADAQ